MIFIAVLDASVNTPGSLHFREADWERKSEMDGGE